MASGDNNNEICENDEDDLKTAEPETNTRNFVTQFITSVAQVDIERGTNPEIAQDIIEKTEPLRNYDSEPFVADLKRIADEIDRAYGGAFDNLVTTAVNKNIIFDTTNGYQYFVEITSSIFENGITLGRIFVLMMFGYRWIVRSLATASNALGANINPLMTIINYLVKFLSSGFVQSFIVSIGGWRAIMHSLSSKATVIFAALAGVFVFLAVLFNK